MFSISSDVVAARDRLTRSESAKMAAIGKGNSGSFAKSAWYESMMSKQGSALLLLLLLLDANCVTLDADRLDDVDAVAAM